MIEVERLDRFQVFDAFTIPARLGAKEVFPMKDNIPNHGASWYIGMVDDKLGVT